MKGRGENLLLEASMADGAVSDAGVEMEPSRLPSRDRVWALPSCTETFTPQDSPALLSPTPWSSRHNFFFLTCMLVLWSYPNLSHYILGSTLQTQFNDNPQSQHFNLPHGETSLSLFFFFNYEFRYRACNKIYIFEFWIFRIETHWSRTLWTEYFKYLWICTVHVILLLFFQITEPWRTRENIKNDTQLS